MSNTFVSASSVAADMLGNTYVADTTTGAVTMLTADGGRVIVGTFVYPIALSVDPSNTLYVLDQTAGSVYAFPSSGNVSTVASGLDAPWGIVANGPNDVYVSLNDTTVVHYSSGNSNVVGTFVAPRGLALHAGLVYVADQGDNSIKQITVDGMYSVFSIASPTSVAIDSQGNLFAVSSTGALVRGDNTILQASGVLGVAVTPYSVAVVVNGTDVTKLSSYVLGQTVAQTVQYMAYGVAADLTGRAIVADFGAGHLVGSDGVIANFSAPAGVAVDSVGNIYVADYGAGTIYRLDATTGLSAVFASDVSGPIGVAVDADDNIYAVGITDPIIHFYSNDSTPLNSWDGSLSQVSSIAVAPNSTIFVTLFNSIGGGEGQLLSLSLDTWTAFPMGFERPVAVAVDASGSVFVGDYNGVWKIDAGGVLSLAWIAPEPSKCFTAPGDASPVHGLAAVPGGGFYATSCNIVYEIN